MKKIAFIFTMIATLAFLFAACSGELHGVSGYYLVGQAMNNWNKDTAILIDENGYCEFKAIDSDMGCGLLPKQGSWNGQLSVENKSDFSSFEVGKTYSCKISVVDKKAQCVFTEVTD